MHGVYIFEQLPGVKFEGDKVIYEIALRKVALRRPHCQSNDVKILKTKKRGSEEYPLATGSPSCLLH
jgi:hypothetical protein